MSKLPTLVRHEIRMLAVSPATYMAAVLALVLNGLLYLWTLLRLSVEPTELSPQALFLSTFWLPVLLVVPMLTMRSVAEERRLGTLETVLAASVRPVELVLSKFIAAYGFYLLIWVLTLAYPLLTVFVLGQPDLEVRLLNGGELAGAYSFLALTGALFVAVGIFSSALTRSQLVAGMLCFSIIFILIIGVWVIQAAGTMSALATWFEMDLLTYFQVFDHFEDALRGVFDTRPLVYYLSGTALVLGLSILVVEAKA